MKHLLYVSTTLPTPGLGSSVIVYRHLKRLKDWRVTILVDDDAAGSRYELPKEWRIIKTAEPRWWWPPVKNIIPGSLTLRLNLLSSECRRILKKERPNAILTQLGKNSLLASHLSKKLGVPFSVIVHDRWQVWSKYGGADRFLTDKLALSVLNQASRVWPVSEEMGNYYKTKDPRKIRVLYPMPEGSGGSFTSWKDEFATHAVVAFAGSYHSTQASTLRLAADNLQRNGGELVIVTKNKSLITKEVGEHSNISYVEPFPQNEQLIAFLKDKASAILISGSIDTRVPGWELSFPSRLVEFVHTGLPVIITGTPGTALVNWAKKHNWVGFAEAEEKKRLERLMASLRERESWEKMSEQSCTVALGEFDPERIQEQFVGEMVVGVTRNQ